jgi:hypothetical protein
MMGVERVVDLLAIHPNHALNYCVPDTLVEA